MTASARRGPARGLSREPRGLDEDGDRRRQGASAHAVRLHPGTSWIARVVSGSGRSSKVSAT